MIHVHQNVHLPNLISDLLNGLLCGCHLSKVPIHLKSPSV